MPVLAVASGGPLETVVEGVTGYLREGEATSFAAALQKLVVELSAAQLSAMGAAGHARVKRLFTLDAFGATLDGYVRQLRRQYCEAAQSKQKGQ